MRIAFLTFGTRGDVQPYVAVAAALVERGHEVAICVPQDLAPFAERAGLSAFAVPLSAQAIMSSELGRRALASGRLRAFFGMIDEAVKGHEDAITDGMCAATADADVVVAAPLVLASGMMLARKMGVPLVRLFLVPFSPTRAFPCPILPPRNLGPFNKLSHDVVQALYWRNARANTLRFANRLGVAPPTDNLLVAAERERVLLLHGYSRVLVERPSDWGDHHVVTGMVRLSAETRRRVGEADAPAGLMEFLDAGAPPVFFGFGSMPVLDPAATLQLIDDVAADLGVRALVGAGWSRLHGATGGGFVVGNFDHDAVLPRCRAAVHHGGAGTTHAALRAGLPAVVCSFLVDQPFWASRLKRLGVGEHVAYKSLSRDRLRAALGAVLDEKSSGRARALAAQLSAEDGARVCAEHIERAGAQGETRGSATNSREVS